MKKIFIMLGICLCLFLTGCSNEFAKNEYDSVEKIAQTQDRYAKENSVFNQFDGGCSLNAAKFDGRQTLWSVYLNESKNIDITFDLSLSSGKAKIIHIDTEGNVTTIIENSPEALNQHITKTVSLSNGHNRLKIVGYDCKDIDLEMLSDDF